MTPMTKGLKQAARRKKVSLRQYVQEAAADGKHPYHVHALRWLKNKDTTKQKADRRARRIKNRAWRVAHPRKPGGKKKKKGDGKKGGKSSVSGGGKG